MKEYNEQVVETLDDAGCIIANKNIIIDNLQARIAELEEENDTLRRIHKESIDILVKELSDKDYEYNQKTNRLIKRLAELIRRCKGEV